MSYRTIVTAALPAVLLLIAWQAGDAAVTKGKSRAAQTKFLMRGVTQPNCAAVSKLLKDAGPADDKAWEDLTCHASLLNEMGYQLLDDGRCPDKTWADAAKTLQAESAKVIAAAESKNLADAQASFKAMTAACGSCHQAHKK
jgi:hypothetical protein